ncbi:MAG: hypothetical protein GY759_17145 [Chloroflexi bacterium]|nr:hypothetical protein [Chloroflexota bacterium]
MRLLIGIIALIILSGCSTVLPRAGTTATASAVGCVAGGPVGCVGGAVVGDMVGDLFFRKEVEVKEPDTFYGLLIKLGEITGWTIGAIVLLPFLLGYVLPQPGRRRKRDRT